MINRFYNEEEYQFIFDIAGKKPSSAKEMLENYIERYPKDYRARVNYVLLLETLNMFTKANGAFIELSEIVLNDSYFINNKKRHDYFRYLMACARLRYLIHQERYQDALDYYEKNKDLFINNNEMSFFRAAHFSQSGERQSVTLKSEKGFYTSQKEKRRTR